jgi:type IV secretion system protein VirB10
MNRVRGIFLALSFVVAAAVPVAAQESKQAEPPAPAKEAASPEKIVVPTGTQLPLVLHNSISTRSAKPGDPVYLETLFPIVVEDRIVIPAGSYVYGEVMESKRPGRVKGRGELSLRLTRLILPNGYAVEFRAVPSGAGTGGNETVDSEGKVKGDTDKSGDVGGVVTTTTLGTAVGAGIGGSRGRIGKGAAIGTAAGAAAGLIWMLSTRGPEVELPRGTNLDITLDRALYLDADKVKFTDPGRASALAGPDNRQPQRRRFPY